MKQTIITTILALENITQRRCMIAVGCRHLMGSSGLIALLRREGYAITPVKR